MLPKIARAYERDELGKSEVVQVMKKLVVDKKYTIEMAYNDIAVTPEENHKLEMAVSLLRRKILQFDREVGELNEKTRAELVRLKKSIDKILN